MAGLELLDREVFRLVGVLVLLAAPFFAAAMLYAIWKFEGDGQQDILRWGWSGLGWTVASVVVSTEVLLARTRTLQVIVLPAVVIATVASAALFTLTIWGDGRVKALSAFAIVAFAGWLATPALERASRPARRTP